MIEHAYHNAEAMGIAVWGQDEAGPFPTEPYPGESWEIQGQPARQPHEHVRNGTAKMLTLLHPADGQVRVKAVTTTTNTVLHAWLKTELTAVLATLAAMDMTPSASNRAQWEAWQAGLTIRATLPTAVPPLRMLLIWDNLAGHKTPDMVVCLVRHGILPLYTALSGSGLNMTESVQRILKRRALAGQYPQTPEQIISWLEATARSWNHNPTPFEWGGKRAARRARSRARRHAVGGSGAYTDRPLRRPRTLVDQWQCAS